MEEEQNFLKDSGSSDYNRVGQLKVRLRRKEVYLYLLWLWTGRILQVGLTMEVKGGGPPSQTLYCLQGGLLEVGCT